jgi:type IV pilus assembly protein PilC
VISGTAQKRSKRQATTLASAQGGAIASSAPKENKIVSESSALIDRKTKLKGKETLHILIQLKAMLEAGVPMLATLRTLIEHAQTARQEKVLTRISTIVEGGNDLSFALACLPNCFEGYVVHLLSAGERAGALDEALNRAVELMQKQMALRGKIIGALAYPLFLLFFTALITVGILILLVPKFETMLMAKPDLLPTSTKIVLGASTFLRESPVVATIAFALLVTGIMVMLKSTKVRSTLFDLISRLPIIGTFIHKAYIARSVTTLALTLESGVPILTGLEHAREVATLPRLQKLWVNAGLVVRDGKPLYSAMEGGDLPPALMQMMIAGETSGSLDESLRTAAGFLDRETDAALKTFTGLLGPATVMIAGLVVGFVVVALMTPILQLSKFIG